MKKRYTEEQIIGFLREADAGLPGKELCRSHGFSEPTVVDDCSKEAVRIPGGRRQVEAPFIQGLQREKMARLCDQGTALNSVESVSSLASAW